MGFIIFVLLLAGIVGGGLWYLRRQGRDARSAEALQMDSPSAVQLGMTAAATMPRKPGRMIRFGDSCCEAAKQIETAWYPDEQAPRLPLEACDRLESCKCQWSRVLDRRMTHRRSGADRRDNIRFEEKPDRRDGLDRRKDSGNSWKQAP